MLVRIITTNGQHVTTALLTNDLAAMVSNANELVARLRLSEYYILERVK